MEGFPKNQPKTNLDPEVLAIIEKLQKMEPQAPEEEKDGSIQLKPPTSSPKRSGGSFASWSLPTGDLD